MDNPFVIQKVPDHENWPRGLPHSIVRHVEDR